MPILHDVSTLIRAFTRYIDRLSQKELVNTQLMLRSHWDASPEERAKYESVMKRAREEVGCA